MPWQVVDDVEDFAEGVAPMLSSDPVRNTIMLTVLDSWRRGGLRMRENEPPLFARYVTVDGRTTGAVLRTPPFELLLGVVPDESVDALVSTLREVGYPVPGASGPIGLVRSFAKAWSMATSRTIETRMRIRLYVLERLAEPKGVGGQPVRATEDDAELATRWFRAFQADAGVHESDVEWSVRDRIRDGRLWLWKDVHGTPVSLAARQRTAVSVARLGPVYTPPEHRRCGYGAAVTAACSRDALRDAERVVLFTDLANPTSNSIYQRIGYREVEDRLVVHFG